MPFLAIISFKTPFYVSREYYIIAICTLKTKIEYKKFLILIVSKKLISAKNSGPGLNYKIYFRKPYGDKAYHSKINGIWSNI